MKPLIDVVDFSVDFGSIRAVNHLNFKLYPSDTLGVVGESGSGKSVTAMAIMGLLPKNAKISGQIWWHNEDTSIDLLSLDAHEHRRLRQTDLSMIFREPMTALNPSIRCGAQIMEAVANWPNAKELTMEWSDKVKLPNPAGVFNAYPHELSGGQRQRVMIAMAMIKSPKLLIADEPTTALDVHVQNEILELIQDLQTEHQTSIMFISHDLGVIQHMAQHVLVLYKGHLMENETVDAIFSTPKNAYTRNLIACKPQLGQRPIHLPTVADFESQPDYTITLENPKERQSRLDELYKQPALLTIKGLSKSFDQKNWWGGIASSNQVLKPMDFSIYPNETLGLVGESGSGKTTIGRIILGLESPTNGEILFKDQSLNWWRKHHPLALKKSIQVVFQDPFSSLNPQKTILEILTEPTKLHGIGQNHSERIQMAQTLMTDVGLDASALNRYPKDFSGGQRQRIGIAKAIAVKPEIIICDESVSALDVSVQAQVLNLLNSLKKNHGYSFLFISHDLSVVYYMSDRLMVIKHGQLLELDNADQVYQNPQSTYTKELIATIPKI